MNNFKATVYLCLWFTFFIAIIPSHILNPIETNSFPLLNYYPNNMSTLVPTVHARGQKLKVMVMDTGIGENKLLSHWVDFKTQDANNFDHHPIFHGTHVTGIIAFNDLEKNYSPICDDVEIIACNIFSERTESFSGQDPTVQYIKNTVDCINIAIKEKVDIINYSNSGYGTSFMEYFAWKRFVDLGGVVVAAAGNNHVNIKENPQYPGSFGLIVPNSPFKKLPNFYTVVNVRSDGNLSENSNWYSLAIKEDGERVVSTTPNDQTGIITGTSQAAPKFTHRIIKKYCADRANSKIDLSEVIQYRPISADSAD